LRGFDAARWAEGLGRIALGIGKKFVIADTLALGMTLTPENAAQVTSTPALWALLYGYALRLYFDFAGYSDIAIGLALLFGVRLPENFSAPYTKTSITAFWQNWHMTLSAWARAYIFSPLSRALLMRRLPPMTVVLIAHLTTMGVIGLWHGITVNFAIWGAWHGLALFIHKQWSDRTRRWFRGLGAHPARKRAWTLFAWLLTLHTVTLGWVWFALPDPAVALRVLGGLFGLWR
jgi:D-alanyl-lipoteichoic acid acyltransferase DltB (MBOAT superfamily)